MSPVPSIGERPEEIATLTGLRGWAALWVLAYHLQRFGLMRPSAWSRRGYLGVEVFFGLSAWVLLHRYHDDWPGLPEFLRRRLARLLPLYWLSQALMLGLWVLARRLGLTPPDALYGDPVHAVATLLLLQAWGLVGALGWNSTAWSVSAEWGAYVLLLPLWRRVGPRLGWGLGLLVLAWGLELGGAAWLGHRNLGFDAWGILRVLGPFSLAAFLWLHGRSLGPAWGDAGVVVALAGMAILVEVSSPGPADVGLALLGPLLVMGLAAQGPLARALTGGAPLRWLGKVSYSFYLLQLPCLAVLALWGGPLLVHLHAFTRPATALLLMLACAWAGWRWVERPGQRWMLRRLTI